MSAARLLYATACLGESPIALAYAAAAAWRSPRGLRAVPRSEYKSAEDGLLDSARVIAATPSLANFAESGAVSDARGGSGVALAECADVRYELEYE